MEQKHGLAALSASYPWLIAQNLEAEDNTSDQIFCTIPDQLSHYQCRIPELFGRCIRGYSEGWVILSKKFVWSLWNPVTCKIIHLPPLILKDGDSECMGQCCLSSPPDDPSSVLLLTRTTKPTFVFCRLYFRRNIFRWTEMSYSRQLKNITGFFCYLYCPTSFNGKIYALNTGSNHHVIQVDIVVKDREVIRLQLFGTCPFPTYNECSGLICFLKGSCTELFFVIVAFNELTKKTLGNVYLFKWVMPTLRWKEMKEKDLKNFKLTRTMWEEMADLKNAVFFVDLFCNYSIFYHHAIASELEGYVHIRDEMGKMIYSYDVEDKTISLSSVPFPTCHLSFRECRLEGDHREAQCILDSKREGEDTMLATSVMDDKVEFNSLMHESGLENIPFHILEMIMELCVGLEYMHFRATCKRCHLAAPLMQWSNKEAATLISPWLMVVDKNKGIITFTDPLFGDKYFMRKSEVPILHGTICCSRFGWLLFRSVYLNLVFVNPFTSDIRKLPAPWRYLDSVCFSAPPSSPDCMVAGFTLKGEPYVYIHLVAREQTWRRIRLNFDGAGPYTFCFPTLYGRDLYTIRKNGEVYVFKNIVQEQEQDYSWSQVVGAQSRFGQYYLVNCDQHLLLVMVGRFGETVEVFKLNDRKKEWEMIESIGRHMIYISPSTCLSIEAKTSEMENKIFFPRLHSKNGKVVFYSLETCRFHTFNGKNIEENSNVGIEHVNPNVWIEPSWS
ncbi:hypothetical protein OROMI_001465 [Orobanche minor]